MPQFRYIAITNKNDSINGTIDAPDRASALASLSRQGLRPISAEEVKPKRASFALFGGNKVRSEDLVMFTRQLSAMVSAGVPLLRAMGSLHDHTSSKALQMVTGDLLRDVEGGMALADALEKHPETFNTVFINMVRAGEAAGILDDILKRLAMQQEKNASMRKKIKSAMTYPTVLIVITIAAFFGLMVFVIPQIGSIVRGLGGPDAKLPAITEFMLGLSAFIIQYGIFIIAALGAGIYFFRRYIKTPAGKLWLHTIILKIPKINDIITKIAVARFARTFSALMGSGVAVLESLRVTARAVGNKVYENALNDAAEQVKNGRNLSSIIEKNPLFPPIVAQMLSVGEETGQTDTVLVKVADYYEEEVDVAIDGISSIIEPVMIVIMGGMVGLIAASVMLPISNMANQIK